MLPSYLIRTEHVLYAHFTMFPPYLTLPFILGIVDGMSIIDLGCGWGSVSIYLASKFPNCKITSVSNSHSQKVFILGRAAERGYKNISVYTGRKESSGRNPSL